MQNRSIQFNVTTNVFYLLPIFATIVLLALPLSGINTDYIVDEEPRIYTHKYGEYVSMYNSGTDTVTIMNRDTITVHEKIEGKNVQVCYCDIDRNSKLDAAIRYTDTTHLNVRYLVSLWQPNNQSQWPYHLNNPWFSGDTLFSTLFNIKRGGFVSSPRLYKYPDSIYIPLWQLHSTYEATIPYDSIVAQEKFWDCYSLDTIISIDHSRNNFYRTTEGWPFHGVMNFSVNGIHYPPMPQPDLTRGDVIRNYFRSSLNEEHTQP